MGQEIQSAVQAGKEVTVHEKPISAHGFTGYGYTITDPETGAGAYLIEGKGNGGWLVLVIAGVLLAFGLYFLMLPFFVLFAAHLGVVLAGLLGVLMLSVNLNADASFSRAVLSNIAWSVIGFALLGLLVPATAVASGIVAVLTVLVTIATAFGNALWG